MIDISAMRIGVVFPQTEIGPDPGAVRAYAEAVEAVGFTHLLAYDHVVGADPEVHKGFQGPYNVATTFHEPLVLFGYLAGLTNLELVTGIIILPQRQTVLVAKQAAEVDLLTGGKFRLGVGIGWNSVEYEALGEEFSTRGARLGEQIDVLRQLWTQESVSFSGSGHTITGAGIAPMPVQRPIPVWFGASSPQALRRAGRLADGWFPQAQPGPKLSEATEILNGAAIAAGRDPSTIGMEGRINFVTGAIDDLASRAELWRDAGASHLSINTMGAGLARVDDHIAALTRTADALGDLNP
jgi:probable F420-dependent oxidoreductase